MNKLFKSDTNRGLLNYANSRKSSVLKIMKAVYFSFCFVGLCHSLLSNDTDETVPNDLKLIFVHTIWRHGDRSPIMHINNDPVDPSKWIKGGGGYGELTPEGMEQHFILGKKLWDRYIRTGFLHNFYDSKQIYIRSTDVNRTINSAISNLLGMFSQSSPRKGTDYPDIDGWPRGFMPVPIHISGPHKSDCVANVFCSCKRTDLLQEIAHQGEEYQNFLNSENYKTTIAALSTIFNEKPINMGKVHGSISIELIHFPEIIRNQTWYSTDFYDKLKKVVRLWHGFKSGLYDPPIVNGINVKREIVKTRGGALFNEISERMRTMAGCGNKCDDQELKYYAYSTHDNTAFSLFVILGLENIVAGKDKQGEWPDYAADIIVELFKRKVDGKPYFRMLYQRNIKEEFETITPKIKGCEGAAFCELEIFENFAKEFRPDKPMKEFCQIPPVLSNRVPTEIQDPATDAPESDDVSTSLSKKSFWPLLLIVIMMLLQ